MMVYQKERTDHMLGNHKGACDHLESRFLFTLNKLQGRMLIVRRFQSKQHIFSPRNFSLSFFNYWVATGNPLRI